MMRAVFAVMAGLLCALAGMRHASSLRGEAQRLRRWGQVLARLALLMQEGALSLPEALCQAAQDQQGPDKLLQDIAAKLRATPLLSLQEAFLALCSDWAEKDVLSRLFAHLGRGSRESRLLAIDQSTQEIALLERQSAQRAEKDAKLWTTLGFTGGACITLFLL